MLKSYSQSGARRIKLESTLDLLYALHELQPIELPPWPFYFHFKDQKMVVLLAS